MGTRAATTGAYCTLATNSSRPTHKKYKSLGANLLKKYRIYWLTSPLVGEGCALETEGEGTLLSTESSLVNKNRNPGKSPDQIESELKSTLGIQKVIWFKGLAGK